MKFLRTTFIYKFMYIYVQCLIYLEMKKKIKGQFLCSKLRRNLRSKLRRKLRSELRIRFKLGAKPLAVRLPLEPETRL